MSIEQAFHALRWSLAKASASRNGRSMSDEDRENADFEINQMGHTKLLEQLALHEDAD